MNSAILFYLIAANVYVFFLMWLDWYQAEKGKNTWPVSEWQMMLLGLCGGGIGGSLAIILFGHKRNRKRMIIMYQLGALVALILFGKMRGWF